MTYDKYFAWLMIIKTGFYWRFKYDQLSFPGTLLTKGHARYYHLLAPAYLDYALIMRWFKITFVDCA